MEGEGVGCRLCMDFGEFERMKLEDVRPWGWGRGGGGGDVGRDVRGEVWDWCFDAGEVELVDGGRRRDGEGEGEG
jgi:hypothetical protein